MSRSEERHGATAEKLGVVAAIARQLCPRCRRGRVFRGVLAMNEACASCGHRFEREPGFFLGAMYVSYAIAVVLYLLLSILVHLVRPLWSETGVLALALPLFLPFVPLIFRYSRVVWMHFDWALDPGP